MGFSLNNFFESPLDLGLDPGTITDFLPGPGDQKAQQRANEINIQEAEKNRRFQERMSNTAYQRAMADMKKAGLNPMLAYMQGGAAVPTGATATTQAASKTGLADFALKSLTGIGSMQQQSTALEQQNNMNQSAIQLNAANSAKSAAEAERARADTRKIQAETKGLGKKESEGQLWKRFYDGANKLLDSTAKEIKDQAQTEANAFKSTMQKIKDGKVKILPPVNNPPSKIFNSTKY